MSDWPVAPPSSARLAVVPGEGIGPSVISAALGVLEAVGEVSGEPISVEWAPVSDARDEFGPALDRPLRSFYRECFASGIPVLHGPAGGRFVYSLRAEFDLAVKITPVRPLRALADASLVRPERAEGADILIVRDNSAGIYQGAFGWRDDGETAFQEASYRPDQVDRVLRPAIAAAQVRRRRLALVVKPGGVPAISRLWRDRAEHLVSDVDLEVLEIDNACYQLIADPTRFDVIVTPNLFGDVVSDTGAALLGSRGMSYSMNIGSAGRSVYQTAHGAAHDLTDRDVANPIAQILTMAWLLRASLGRGQDADAIEDAVAATLSAGLRTTDCAAPGSKVVGTAAMAEAIADRIHLGAR